MANNNGKIIFSNTVKEVDGKILRTVHNIDDTKKITDVIQNNNILSDSIVDTEIYSYENKTVQHEFLKGIIHSEEYTETMAFDVSELALKMSIEFEKFSIYGWDLLPHNFTFYNGKWIFYDFGGLSLETRKMTALIRGFFKIVFSSFEFAKFVSRKEMGALYLNRVKCSDVYKMIPFFSWLKYFINLEYSLYLIRTKQYKSAYEFLYKILKNYYSKNKKNKNIYIPKINSEDEKIYDILAQTIYDTGVFDIFSAGEDAAKFLLPLNENIHKTVYIDDYDLCDEVYNYIKNNHIKNVNIGVLYPLENDKEIPVNYSFRAVYDNYAKKRFNSDCAICLEKKDNDFIKNLSDFANKLLIVKAYKRKTEDINLLLTELYSEIKTIEHNNETVFMAFNKKVMFRYIESEKSYKNFNRGILAQAQTEEIKALLKSKRY